MLRQAFIFTGQGSQYVGMGRDLYDTFKESKAVFDAADKALASLGFSISKLCFEGPEADLTLTQNCQPAVLTMSIAAFEAFKANAGQQRAEFCAGLSLGEYSALVAAQAISLEDAVRLVRRRGEFMEEEARKSPGGMVCVIGMELSAVEKLCAQTRTEIANLNCPGQIVISGGAADIQKVQQAALDSGAKRALPLDVSGAFHSSYMKGASLKLAQELNKIKISKPVIPVVSNVTAKTADSPEEIRENLIKQVASPVLWEASMKFIISNGIKDFTEFGPSKVLKGLMRKIDDTASVTSIEKKEDIRKETR